MKRIGLVGFGVVNSGVYDIISKRQDSLNDSLHEDVEIVKILVRDIHKARPDDVDPSLFTDDVDEFFAAKLDVVAEAITNREVSYHIIKRALEHKIDVVSASKATISKYYKELLTCAEDHGARLFFEASVAAGVPIIKPLRQVLYMNDVFMIQAILNGTTNFILSKMYEDMISFDEALKLSQELGYAEADPTDDIEGFDSLRKLVILSNLSYKTIIDEDQVPTEGITSITKEDIDFIKDLGLIVKLIGSSVVTEQGIGASVEPMLFSKASVYNTVELSTNIVSVTGNNIGELQFIGPGAGKLETANSMVSDIVDISVKHTPIVLENITEKKLLGKELFQGMYYVRMSLRDHSASTLLDILEREDIPYDIIHRTEQLVLITDRIPALTMDAIKQETNVKDITTLRLDEGAISIKFIKRTKPLIVQKYGGTSVSSAEKINAIAKKIVERQQAGYDVMVVVSAMGQQTDELVKMASLVSDHPTKRELDVLLSTGEQISISLLTMALHNLGANAIALTTTQSGIITDDFHNNASIIKVHTNRFKKELHEGNIVVIPGFQGVNLYSDITTLGRGGSDTTAVALSAVMNAERCEIYTDVDGVYTADPRIVKNAHKWDKISYDEMLELASLGAQIMHPRSIELAKKYHVPLVIQHSNQTTRGTTIMEVEDVEKVLVRGVTKDTDIVKVSIMEVPDMPGIAYHLFDQLAEQKVMIDTIIQAVSRENINDISFTVHKKDLQATVDACENYVKEIHTGTVVVDKNVVKLSIVGIGMAGGYKVASTFFKALYESGINIQMISTSEIKISCIIEDKFVNDAINRIHEYFQLGEVVNIDNE